MKIPDEIFLCKSLAPLKNLCASSLQSVRVTGSKPAVVILKVEKKKFISWCTEIFEGRNRFTESLKIYCAPNLCASTTFWLPKKEKSLSMGPIVDNWPSWGSLMHRDFWGAQEITEKKFIGNFQRWPLKSSVEKEPRNFRLKFFPMILAVTAENSRWTFSL